MIWKESSESLVPHTDFFSVSNKPRKEASLVSAADQVEVKEEQENKRDTSTDALPGISLHMNIRIINASAPRRKYFIDFGHIDGPRLSVYLSSDNVFTLMFVDNKKEPHPVQIPLGGDDIPIGRFFYLACEIGEGGNITMVRILSNGSEIRRLDLPFKTDIGSLTFLME